MKIQVKEKRTYIHKYVHTCACLKVRAEGIDSNRIPNLHYRFDANILPTAYRLIHKNVL